MQKKHANFALSHPALANHLLFVLPLLGLRELKFGAKKERLDSELRNRHAVPEPFREKPRKIPYIFNRKAGLSASPPSKGLGHRELRNYEAPPIEFRTGPNGVVYGAISARKPQRLSAPSEYLVGKSIEETTTMPGTAIKRGDETREDTAYGSVNASIEFPLGGTRSPSPVAIRQGKSSLRTRSYVYRTEGLLRLLERGG